MNPRAPTPLRVALIGAGANIAAQHLAALAETEDAELVAVCDPALNAEQAEARFPGAAFHADHRALLAEVRPDVTAILTPHPSHADIARDAFAAGSHVLVEKPMAVQTRDADRMIADAARHDRRLAVSFQQRFAPLAERARALIDQGVLGRLQRVSGSEPWVRTAAYFQRARWRATWRGEGGGVLLNQAPHLLDLVCHLAGMPSRVWGVTGTLHHATECEDTAHALLGYDGGATGYVASNTIEAGATRRLELVGDRARLLLEDDRLMLSEFDPPLSEHRARDPDPFGAPALRSHPPERLAVSGTHAAVYRDLVAAIREDRPCRVDGREGRMSLELANAIALSSHLERPVDLPLDRDAYAAFLEGKQAV